MTEAVQTYARIDKGTIVEYPVLAIHIINRGHPFTMYTPVVYNPTPPIPLFYSANEVLSIGVDDSNKQCVFVNYTMIPLTLEFLFTMLPGWAPEGEEPTPITEMPDPLLVARIQELTKDRITEKLNAFAKTRGYDDIVSLTTYATDPRPKFKAEGQCGVELRGATWEALYAYNAEVANGTIALPKSYADIDRHLPLLRWPDETVA